MNVAHEYTPGSYLTPVPIKRRIGNPYWKKETPGGEIEKNTVTSYRWAIDNKYYVTGMGNSNLTNDIMRVETIKRH